MTQALQYFVMRKAEDPTFVYRFDLDEEKKVKNIFWSDGTSLKNYADMVIVSVSTQLT